MLLSAAHHLREGGRADRARAWIANGTLVQTLQEVGGA